MKNSYKSYEESWLQQLELHDAALPAIKEYDNGRLWKKVGQAFKNKRKRILWNITRARNLQKEQEKT